ncbi:MAG: diguanylate cyclase [Sporomusaceae bacterium]|nr:diguanylate cyclase [Sporomusaceae bacterium]
MKNKIYRLALSGELAVQLDDLNGSYHSVDAMLKGIKEPSVILIDGLRPEDDNILSEAFDAVYQLRRSALFYAAPIYFAKSMVNLNPFVDGIGSKKEDILPYASEILTRMNNISIETNAVNDDLRLLTFLLCRGDAYSLPPLALAASPWIYEYPAAFLIGGFADATIQTAFRSVFFTNETSSKVTLRSSAEWLVSLCTQGLLVTMGLVDRIRICPYCHTGNFNYIDSCPVCKSIDFTKKKMIHCYTCGHVAPDENFKNGMMLICPRCNAALRHVGSDYDRPVESYLCNSCSERFIEPDVKADCLKCRKKSAAEDLTVRQLYNYGITAKGKRAVQIGIIDFEFSLFDNNRSVLPLYFYHLADWLLQMKVRYSDEDFSLLCIKIVGLEARESRLGVTQFKNLVDELATRIRELVRLTDITTTTGANTFWVILPRTNQKGGELLASRVEKLADMVSLEQGAHINIQVKCFSIPIEYGKRGPVAEMLLGEYEATFLEVK